jgi:hypothetical protein
MLHFVQNALSCAVFCPGNLRNAAPARREVKRVLSELLVLLAGDT